MKNGNALKYLTYLSHLLLTMAANVFVGFIIGYYLDRWLGTVPLFLTVFCFIGFLSGIKSVYTMMMKIDRRNKS